MGAAVAGAGHERFHAVALLRVDERADLRARIEAVAEAQCAGCRGQAFGERGRGEYRRGAQRVEGEYATTLKPSSRARLRATLTTRSLKERVG